MKKIHTFINTCLRRILKFAGQTSSATNNCGNERDSSLRKMTSFKDDEDGLHTLRKPASSITKQALSWNPQGERKRGRRRNTWRCDLEADMTKNGYTWGDLEQLAQDRDGWGVMIGGLCPRGGCRR